MSNSSTAAATPKKSLEQKKALQRKSLGKRIAKSWQLYLLLLIPIIITIVYKYGPMYGIQIAFRDYKPRQGFFGSKWVGFDWFIRFFTAPNFKRMIINTIKLSVFGLLWSFPVPIILSLVINQLRFKRYKRVVQTILYAPHFISIMVVCGMIRIFLSPYGGLINLLSGGQVDFMTIPEAFRTIYISSGIWQDAGWGTIIYLATLSAVDPGLYEAAKIDGASMFQRIVNIDLPELLPMIILQLIMSASGIMSVGFEKVFLLQTELNKAASDVIATYVYQQGIVDHMYSYSTAIGLFNTVINIILLIIVNKIAKKFANISFV
ncbi:MAG: ABC transporter permease subunit [Muribaculum sp.]|nr:ABC transporter permease subunit [Muribaculum sp.]